MGLRFNSPPGWPVPPLGWTPPVGWKPDASWPPAPVGWQFWVPDGPPTPAPAPPYVPAATSHGRVPVISAPTPPPPTADSELPPASSGLFGSRRKQLEANQTRLLAEIEELKADQVRLRAEAGQLKIANERLRAENTRLLGADPAQLRAEVDTVRAEIANVQEQKVAAGHALTDLHQLIEAVRGQLVQTQELALLQEAGIYQYLHPLEDAVAYKARLAQLQDALKSMVRNEQAVLATTNWTVNGSAREGKTMVRDFSRLMLRAYNAEADNCVRSVRPHRVQAMTDRLTKVRETIARLGKTMSIRISEQYHDARVLEIRLTADYLGKVEEEKERVRAKREQQREEEQARRDFEREKARLAKEQAHYLAALAKVQASGAADSVAELRDKLDEIAAAIAGVEAREANIRAGYVYVISNLGAFGPDMIKIGMTRRLEPQDRIRELGDASVPFKFDTHAMIFSEDAVGLETRLHNELADRRVNRVNTKREFFYATPVEVRELLTRVAGQHLLEFHETPEAIEWRSSGHLARPTVPASTEANEHAEPLVPVDAPR